MSNYVDEYREMIDAAYQPAMKQIENQRVLGTIESEEDGTAVRFIEEAEVVTDDSLAPDEVRFGDVVFKLPAESALAIERLSTGSAYPAGEARVVDPNTGGMKGSKLARFSMIPQDVLRELAEHYGKGEAKYPSDPETGEPNWQKGYNWRLSVDALERHLNAWLTGEDTDEETGSSHLIAVMWHAAALRWFQLHGRGRDYRSVANGNAA